MATPVRVKRGFYGKQRFEARKTKGRLKPNVKQVSDGLRLLAAYFKFTAGSSAIVSAKTMRHIVFNHFKQTRASCNPFRHIIRQGLTHLGSSGFKIFHIAPTGYVN
ncbi:TPA: hypothetical protein ACFP37_001144 [Neisseria subflava]|uniref:hypothetical protein n=1 Tax=uncultured Neisseria sp. TaxID=237778 RepID=UPI002629F985|nr:hypothetical protein [uncultured Neisseria sp.]